MSASVTIVIPTFNRAAWLPGAIDSVLAQEHEDLEVLVVDDGSEDETGAVLERYAATHDRRRFRSLRQANAGQAAAINRGWSEARGEFVGYLSDDDRLLQRRRRPAGARARAQPGGDDRLSRIPRDRRAMVASSTRSGRSSTRREARSGSTTRSSAPAR